MIDQSLINIVNTYIEHKEPLRADLAEELLNNYKQLIEQNSELYKCNQKLKSKCKDLIYADDMNTGWEPGISVFQREIDLLKGVLDSD